MSSDRNWVRQEGMSRAEVGGPEEVPFETECRAALRQEPSVKMAETLWNAREGNVGAAQQGHTACKQLDAKNGLETTSMLAAAGTMIVDCGWGRNAELQELERFVGYHRRHNNTKGEGVNCNGWARRTGRARNGMGGRQEWVNCACSRGHCHQYGRFCDVSGASARHWRQRHAHIAWASEAMHTQTAPTTSQSIEQTNKKDHMKAARTETRSGRSRDQHRCGRSLVRSTTKHYMSTKQGKKKQGMKHSETVAQ